MILGTTEKLLPKTYSKKLLPSSLKNNTAIYSVELSKAKYKFDAEITVLRSHSTTIKINYEPVVHSYAIRQTVTLINIQNKINSRNNTIQTAENILRTGDKSLATFMFKYRPEYIKPGFRILLAEGGVKIIGVVTKIY